MRSRPTGNVNRLEVEEAQYKGGNLEARMNHLQVELEEVRKLKQVGKYSGRHKGEGEKDQRPRCTYERNEAGQKCPAEDRTCNTCGEKGHFAMSKLCTKKKKKAARRVKEEQKDTSSESSDTEGEQEVNRIIREQTWPGTSATARRRDVRQITTEGTKDEDKSEGGNESESTDESKNGDTEGEQENNQVNWDRVWPGTRERARRRSIGHATEEGGMYKARGAGRSGKEQAGTRPNVILKTEPKDNSHNENVITKAKNEDGMVQGNGAGLDEEV